MKYTPIDPALFTKNRNRLADLLEINSLSFVTSADLMPRNGDLFHAYRQNSDLFYLTGIEQENSTLIIRKENNTVEAFLFITEPDQKMIIWEGPKLTIDEAKAISGINNVYYNTDFQKITEELSYNINTFYIAKNENPRFASNIQTGEIQLENKLKENFNKIIFKSLYPFISQCRLLKDEREIELIKKACDITKNAFLRVLKTTKPGMKEYEVEAEISYEFLKAGASGHAYAPIIASGKNSCYLHYVKNNATLKSGDILFLDFGAEYANYASDCSRAIPINGKFTQRQKEVYEAVMKVFYEARKLIVPGTTIAQYHKIVCKHIEEMCLKLNLFSLADLKNQDNKNPLFYKYYMHGTSHFIGLDTHDCGSKETILEPGMIVSCEPGIYIAEEGLGIRLENDILITQNGNIDLLEEIPLSIEEIEYLMHK
ncbi:MAG: aminopeptidase P family protein [Bacteroidales bacterium]|nr:aminopeptidase P family protein [Bacteroidales bacterium]